MTVICVTIALCLAGHEVLGVKPRLSEREKEIKLCSFHYPILVRFPGTTYGLPMSLLSTTGCGSKPQSTKVKTNPVSFTQSMLLAY